MLDIVRDPIFQQLPVEAVDEIARCLSWDPFTTDGRNRRLRALAREEQLRWLQEHRNDLEDEVFRLGGCSYPDMVRMLARRIKASYREGDSTPRIEKSIIAKVWNEAIGKLSSEDRAKLHAQATRVAQEHGKKVAPDIAGFAALTAAQLFGFGVYMAGATLLGGLNGALGLGLSFGAFTAMSSLISVVIGPLGFALLGLSLLAKLFAPKYKKMLPVVTLVAMNRPEPPAARWNGKRIAIALVLLFVLLMAFARGCA